ncbi:Ku protein [Gorillibacterium massiliense]|uniref:non-homologous end joining protein Ku n=1 Tax=Gorillibacterium massiliense TaxID=1280390 RepID=UPI0004AF7B1C|nr:Ku protein [Gorillibacterium massiliense]
MHTIWKGAISFGLVNVPVKMFAATEDKDISMRLIHKDCATPLNFVRKCKTCDREVEWEEISKGYEYEPGRFVLFEKDELEQLAGEKSREIKILDFVDLKEIDPVYFQKTYYLGPGDTGIGAYNLLLESINQTGKIGIASVSVRSKSSLAAIRVIGRCIAMETIFYPDEIRSVAQVPNLPESVQINEKELTMAKMLIEQLSTSFEPEKYKDVYREAVAEAIQRKVSGQEILTAPEPERANVIDLMAALQASLDATKAAGASEPGAGAVTPPAAAAAKPRARKPRLTATDPGTPPVPAAGGGDSGLPKPRGRGRKRGTGA